MRISDWSSDVCSSDLQRRQRRPEFVRRTRREQPHAHDMILLGRALATGGERGVAVAQIAADPRDEGDEQYRDQQEADEAALQIKPQRIVGIRWRQDRKSKRVNSSPS